MSRKNLRLLPLLLALVVLFSTCAAEPAVFPEGSVAGTITHTPDDPIRYIVCTEEDIHRGDLLLVNRTATYDASLCAGEITDVRSARVTDIQEGTYALPIGRELLQTLETMQTDLQSAMKDNVCLLINDSYRSAETQQAIMEDYLALYGQDYVNKYVAPVGNSEHHTALAVDLSFYNLSTGAILATTAKEAEAYYAWLLNNCYRYGLILRYTPEKETVTGYSAESWHFRYVGVPHAVYITSRDLALEEYLTELKTTSVDRRLSIETETGERYSVYYVPATSGETQVPVPEDKPYTLSGNNLDGFIVTVQETG